MSATIDRQAWPWQSAPADCVDYDAAVWHATRALGPELPRQSLEEWVTEQRRSRHWDRLEPEPLTEAEMAEWDAGRLTEAQHRAFQAEIFAALTTDSEVAR